MSKQPFDQAAKPPAETGLKALAVTLARLRAAAAAEAPPSGEPQPGNAWERRAEQRLSVIEKTQSNQNRLLLLTLVSVVADVVIGATK
jgi:hypothetical protein